MHRHAINAVGIALLTASVLWLMSLVQQLSDTTVAIVWFAAFVIWLAVTIATEMEDE